MLTAERKSFFLDLQCRVSGMRHKGADLQRSAQAVHTMGTTGNTRLPGGMGTGKPGERGCQGI